MKIIFMLILLMLNSLTVMSDQIYEDLYVEFRATALLYKTSRNNLTKYTTDNQDTNSENGFGYFVAGAAMRYDVNNRITISAYSTTQDLYDFGFIDIRPVDSIGVRIGRVNKLSGFFSGIGPSADYMNFLPQGSDPTRFDNVFFRYDGFQLYYSDIIKDVLVDVDLTVGEPKLEDTTGLFDPTFFILFSKDKFSLYSNRETYVTNLRLNYFDWQLHAEYINAIINFDALYEFKIDDGFGGTQVVFSEQVRVPKYYVSALKVGIGYSFLNSELLLTYFEQYGRMPQSSGFSIGGQSLGGKFKPIGASILLRTPAPKIGGDILYAGYSYYKIDLDSDILREYGINAEKHIDYQHNFILGYVKRFNKSFTSIFEYQWNVGTATLSATYQDPLESSKYWSVTSLSLNWTF